MEPIGIGMAGLGVAGLSTLGAFGLAFRQRRRRLRASAAMPAAHEPRSAADRLEALGQAQAELGLRLDALAAKANAPEERLQAMAGQLVGLIRDKNATLETALAGLDQLRARMRALEQMGEPAEARALVDGLAGRLDGARRPGPGRRVEARLAALAREGAALAERLTGARGEAHRLSRRRWRGWRPWRRSSRRSSPGATPRRRPGARRCSGSKPKLEAQAAEAVGGEGRARGAEGRGRGRARARRAADPGAGAEGGAGRRPSSPASPRSRPCSPPKDPAPALARLAERLAALETAENPFAEISEQLTRLYAQKDATVETVLRAAGAAGGAARRARPDGGARPLRRAAGGGAGPGGGARRRREPVRRDLRAADPALRPEGRDGGDGVRAAGAAGGEARRRSTRRRRSIASPSGWRRCRAGGDARGGREPVRRDLGAADPALRAEGRDGGDGVRPARAARGAARRSSTRRRRSTVSPSGWRRCRAGWRRSRRPRTRSPRFPSS